MKIKKRKPRYCGVSNKVIRIYFFADCLLSFGIGIKTGLGFFMPSNTARTSLQFIVVLRLNGF